MTNTEQLRKWAIAFSQSMGEWKDGLQEHLQAILPKDEVFCFSWSVAIEPRLTSGELSWRVTASSSIEAMDQTGCFNFYIQFNPAAPLLFTLTIIDENEKYRFNQRYSLREYLEKTFQYILEDSTSSKDEGVWPSMFSRE